MNAADLTAALGLPDSAQVDQRVPKKLLVENGAPTAADKRLINEGIEEIQWLAALKPTTIGVSEYRDETREYLEIAVLAVALREATKATRLVELIHRAIPYPLVLFTRQADAVSLSLAHKRWSHGEMDKVVIDEVQRTASFNPEAPKSEEVAFFASLAISNIPKRDLFTLYQGWYDRITSLEAARITGIFAVPDSTERMVALREGLKARTQLNADLAQLRAQAAKEKQLSRRVELNLKIKGLEEQLAAAISTLK